MAWGAATAILSSSALHTTFTLLALLRRQKQQIGKLAVEDANQKFYQAFMSGRIEVRRCGGAGGRLAFHAARGDTVPPEPDHTERGSDD